MEKLVLDKGIIYYTHNDLKTRDRDILFTVVQEQIKKANLPITSCSLRPMSFGNNIVFDAEKGPVTYFRQILTALENAKQTHVFFCEHDVLYHPSHFEFTPERDDTFYYNNNVWRWNFYGDLVVTYDHLNSVSGICANRELATDFYKKRLKFIYDFGLDKVPTFGNPHWAREMGYEPGKKTDAKILEWQSAYPNIDVRHQKNMTIDKITMGEFRRKPKNWREDSVYNLPGWDIKSLFHERP